jgi:hypothetical protein
MHIKYNVSYDRVYIYTIWHSFYLIKWRLLDYMEVLGAMEFSGWMYDLRKQTSRQFPLNCLYTVFW